LPALRLVVQEHRALHVRCPHCQTVRVGAFPPEASSRAQYGPHLRAFAVYLVEQQFVPYGRVRELFADLFGASVSLGTLVTWVQQRDVHPKASQRDRRPTGGAAPTQEPDFREGPQPTWRERLATGGTLVAAEGWIFVAGDTVGEGIHSYTGSKPKHGRCAIFERQDHRRKSYHVCISPEAIGSSGGPSIAWRAAAAGEGPMRLPR
jgi:hypothetical protein